MSKSTSEAVASNAELGKLYADRDHLAQGNYYLRHVVAMTDESLYRKSAIAGELAHRDMEIDRLNSERLDLALLVGRLIRRMRAARIGDGLAEGDAVLEEEVLGYMRRKGLASPLRNEAPNVRVQPPA